MSKKSHGPTAKQEGKGKHADEQKRREEAEEIPEGSAKRRLKKLSEINPAEEMLEPSGEEDNLYLVNEAEAEEGRGYEPKYESFLKKREAAEQLKKPSRARGSAHLDAFIEKEQERGRSKREGKEKEGKEREGKEREGKEREKPRYQLTIEETMRFKKEQKKPRKRSEEFAAGDEEDLSEEAQIRKAKRISAYQQYNGSMQDEQKLIEMALKLSLTASSVKHENLEDYAFEEAKPEPTRPAIKQSVPLKQERQAVRSREPKEQARQVKKQASVKKEVKRTKSISKQPKSGPLAGLVIAFTGGYEGIDKDKLIEVCEQLGAECPKSITRKCNLLLQGSHVEDHFKRRINTPIAETQKSKDARERGIRIVAFTELEDFFTERTGLALDDLISKNQVRSLPIAGGQAKAGAGEDTEGEGVGRRSDGRVWTEKYKPARLEEVIGESSQIKALREWLESWEDIHLRGNKREVKEARGWNAGGNINSPAALISGDPGIGKTTTARLLAAEYNYSATEFNASDVRNKSGVAALESRSYNLDIFRNLARPLIIMDEVDGMSSGDRGGVAAIIAKLKTTTVPIICICNDRGSEKIRALAAHCLDVKFHKPHKGMVVRRLKEILAAEGGSGEERALEQLVEGFQNDMRQLLNYLELIFKTVSRRITVDALTARARSAKDASVMINHFEAARRLMNRTEFSAMKIQQRIECFFIDSDIVPIMVHENLLASARKTAPSPADFHRLVEGLKGMAIGDMLSRTIRKEQEWGLMPSFGFLSCVYPTEKISESLGFPQFPAWLGKFSSERKMKRLAREFKNAIFPATANASSSAAKNLYAPVLAREISDMVRQDAVEEAVLLMEQYRITPLMVGEHLSALVYAPGQPNPLAEMPGATKGKLTRLYNKRHEEVRLMARTKGKKEQQKHVKYDPLMEEPEEEQEEPESDKEKENQESLPKAKGKSKGKESKGGKK